MKSIKIEVGNTPLDGVEMQVDLAINSGAMLIHCVGLNVAGQKVILAKCVNAWVGFQADNYPPEFPVKGCSSIPVQRCL